MTATLDRPAGSLSVVAPDPVVRWLAVVALALGGFGIGTTEFVSMGLLPDIATGLRVSEPVAGHVISAYALGVMPECDGHQNTTVRPSLARYAHMASSMAPLSVPRKPAARPAR